MNYHETRRYVDLMKRKRDYAEYVASQIKQRGNDKSAEATAYKNATDEAGVTNRYMIHRGEE